MTARERVEAEHKATIKSDIVVAFNRMFDLALAIADERDALAARVVSLEEIIRDGLLHGIDPVAARAALNPSNPNE